MKKLFSFFSMLVLVVLSVGCSDNETEDSVRRIYPTEEQKPVEISEAYGRLVYNEENQKWTINSLDFPLTGGDEEGAELYIENPGNEINTYEGDIKYSGHVTYLYTDIHQLNSSIATYKHYYSINLTNIESINNTANGRSVTNLTCKTPTSEPPLWIFSKKSRTISNTYYIVNVFVHIIRTSSGTGLNKENVSNTIISNLNSYYNNANIGFNLLGSEYIDSDTYLQYTDEQIENLFNINPHNYAIDIYILSTATNIIETAGLAQDITSTACFIHPSYYALPTVAHEIGHCLGLFHTHHGTSVKETKDACPELVDGSNSETCGDYITDTPADPCIWYNGVYVGTGTDENGDIYVPDPTNLMSYNGIYRTQFTPKQIEFIRSSIENETILQNTLHTRVIEGDNHFCSSAVYNISFLKNNETANWTVTKYYPSSTADDQPLSSQTTTYSGSSITLNASNQSAYYVIQATINGTTTLTKTVTSYAPSPYVGTLAWETTDGQFGVTTNMEHGNTLYVSGTKTLSFEYLDQGGNTEANFTCITAANRYLSGSTITLQTSDCTSNLKIRTSNSCGTSGNFFTIPCEVTSYSYNLNLNNSTLSIDVEETAKASLASALSIRESDIKTSGDIQSIKVRNADGQVIFTKNYSVATKGVRIDTSSWLPGEYILEITNGDMTQKRKIRIR